MSLEETLPEILHTSKRNNGLKRGLREVVKFADKRMAQVVVLSNDCDEPQYTKLIEALCATHNIPLVRVESSKKLGEWVGQCKLDREGKARKVVACSSCCIIDFGDAEQLTKFNEIIK